MNALQLIRHGQQLLAERKLDKAEEVSRALMAERPDLPPIRYFACEVAMARGAFPTAMEHINEAIAKDTEAPALYLMKAQVALALRRGIEAQQCATKAAELKPEDPALLFQAAMIFVRADNPKGAEPHFLKARDLGAENPHFLFELAKNRFYCGAMDEASEALERFLKIVPTHGEALMLRAKLKTQSEANNNIVSLKSVLAQNLNWQDEVGAAYALAKENEDIGRYDDAFAAIKRGAETQRAHLQYRVEDETRNMLDIAKTFTKEAYNQIPEGHSPAMPIFVVGMPRTGTTLAERILARHKDVTAGGEFNDFSNAMRSVINAHIAAHPDRKLSPLTAALEANYDRMGEIYSASIQGMIGTPARFTDKLPFNFLYCGLIGKALPNARIVHLLRDPMDTCFAVYKTLFNQAYFFSYTLEEIADYYIAYRALMAHWHKVMPGQILDVSYEALVADPVAEGKRMAEHCGLDWSDDMASVEKSESASTTASAAQIRERIYTSSVGNWRNFEKHLTPLRDKLAAAGLIDG